MASFPPIDRDRYSLLPGCQARCQVKVPEGLVASYCTRTVLYPVSLAVSVTNQIGYGAKSHYPVELAHWPYP